MRLTKSNIFPVSLLLVITLAIVTPPALAAGSVTRSMQATAAPGATVTVTLTPSSDFTTSPGWGVTETLPAGWTFVSTTADGHSVVAGAYRFVELSATPITYTVTAPAASGAYTFSGTYVDGNRNTGIVGGLTSVTAGATAAGTVTNSLPATAAPSSPATVALTPTPALTIPPQTSTNQPPTIAPIVTSPILGSPLMLAIAGVIGIIIIIGLVYVVRRWWIRRQNPALFRKYD